MRYLTIGLFVLIPLMAFAQESEFAGDIPQRPYFPQSELAVRGQDGELSYFRVELATSEKQRNYGLMFLKSMDQNEGMLFDFGSMRKVRMWMKNTEIPLDMVFVGESGKILHIVKNTQPLSEDVIHSMLPVRAVLELNAGATDDFFIQVGDQVVHPMFGSTL